MAHWFCRLYTLDTPNEKGELRSIVFFSILLALGVREVTFSSFFQKENMMILCFLIMVSLVQPLEDNYELFK